MGTVGNEIADMNAKEGTTCDLPLPFPHSMSYIKTKIKERIYL